MRKKAPSESTPKATEEDERVPVQLEIGRHTPGGRWIAYWDDQDPQWAKTFPEIHAERKRRRLAGERGRTGKPPESPR